jgi:hypothetical protein
MTVAVTFATPAIASPMCKMALHRARAHVQRRARYAVNAQRAARAARCAPAAEERQAPQRKQRGAHPAQDNRISTQRGVQRGGVRRASGAAQFLRATERPADATTSACGAMGRAKPTRGDENRTVAAFGICLG